MCSDVPGFLLSSVAYSSFVSHNPIDLTPQTLSPFDSVAADSGSSAQRANRLLLLMMWTFQAGSAGFRVSGLELMVLGGHLGTIQRF